MCCNLFGHEEGRIRAQYDAVGTSITGFVYDYMLKDHLGNVRIFPAQRLLRPTRKLSCPYLAALG